MEMIGDDEGIKKKKRGGGMKIRNLGHLLASFFFLSFFLLFIFILLFYVLFSILSC